MHRGGIDCGCSGICGVVGDDDCAIAGGMKWWYNVGRVRSWQ